MKIESPYHAGELQVQERLGVLSEGAKNAQVIQDSIVKGALRYISQQPMAVLGSLDHEQNVWASVFMGRPGFMKAEDERTVTFDLTTMAHNPYDPFWENIQQHPEMGMLAIELASRRRLRINGKITHVSDDLLRFHVEESYPNCPKYIQRRQVTTPLTTFDKSPLTSEQGNVLGPGQREMITKADTFFVASVHPERGVDASHRGGLPGFVNVVDDRTLRIPDYPGNSMFNTLGNFTVNPKAGLIFLDFASHRTLQLIGRPEIIYDVDGSTEETGGTKRYWQLHIDRWIEISHAHRVAWSFLDYSPYNLPVNNVVGKIDRSQTELSDPQDWVDLHGDYLFRFAMRRVENPELAQDLVQETFLAALQARDRFTGKSAEKTWLVGILKHKLLDHYRKARREFVRDDGEQVEVANGDEEVFDKEGHWKLNQTTPKEWPDDPSLLIEQKEFWKELNQVLLELPPRTAKAFVLREVDGFTTQEICDILNTTPSNLWVILYRARMHLRNRLESRLIEHGRENFLPLAA